MNLSKSEEPEKFEDKIIEEGLLVASHFWNTGNPGAGAGVTNIYWFEGQFYASTDLGWEGPYDGLTEAAEAVSLLSVTATTESIWVDYKVAHDT
jgi:hypothetical protein